MSGTAADRSELEASAIKLGISFRSNWKDETLAEKIAEAEAENALISGDGGDEPQAAPPVVSGPDPETQPVPDAQTEAKPETGAGAPEPLPVVVTETEIQPGADVMVIETITITGPKQGRWRAGRRFTKEPVTIPVDDLSEAEICALEDDPKLVVTLNTA